MNSSGLALKTALAVVLGGAGLFIALEMFLPDCSSSSRAVSRARALSEQELAALYKDMEELSRADSHGELPARVAALEPRNVRFQRPSITLEGCFDHYVILGFHGIPGTEYAGDEPGIVLRWGEFEPDAGEVRLWRP